VKLSERRVDKIIEAIKAGATHRLAAQASGIDASTFYEWMRLGKTARRGPLKELYDRVTEAEGGAALTWLKTIDEASRGCSPECDLEHEHIKRDWKAAAWKLERRFPADYARRKEAPEPQKLQGAAGWEVLPFCGDAATVGAKVRFLGQVEEWYAFAPACKAAGIPLIQCTEWLNDDEAFRQAFAQAQEFCTQMADGAMYRAAVTDDPAGNPNMTARFGFLNAKDPTYGIMREQMLDRRMARIADALADDLSDLPAETRDKIGKKIDRLMEANIALPPGRRLQ
jgi:hypothetical protein